MKACSKDGIDIYIPKSMAAFTEDIKYEQKIVTVDVENFLFFKKLIISGVDIVFI